MTACQCKKKKKQRPALHNPLRSITRHFSETTAMYNTSSHDSHNLCQLLRFLTSVSNVRQVYTVYITSCFFTYLKTRFLGQRRWLTFCCWNCSFSFWACFFRELFSCWRLSICNRENTIFYLLHESIKVINYNYLIQICFKHWLAMKFILSHWQRNSYNANWSNRSISQTNLCIVQSF